MWALCSVWKITVLSRRWMTCNHSSSRLQFGLLVDGRGHDQTLVSYHTDRKELRVAAFSNMIVSFLFHVYPFSWSHRHLQICTQRVTCGYSSPIGSSARIWSSKFGAGTWVNLLELVQHFASAWMYSCSCFSLSNSASLNRVNPIISIFSLCPRDSLLTEPTCCIGHRSWYRLVPAPKLSW